MFADESVYSQGSGVGYGINLSPPPNNHTRYANDNNANPNQVPAYLNQGGQFDMSIEESMMFR